MFPESDIRALGVLKTADLFTDEYVSKMFPDSCQSYCDWDENKVHYFIGFKMDDTDDLWKEFSYMEIDKKTGNVDFLDYKLPSGFRMESPKLPIRLA